MRKVLYFIGFIFVKIRYLVYKIIAVYNSNAVNNNGGYISGQTIIANPKNIYIGKGSSINGGQIRAGKKARITIGENCIISYNVHIRADSHNYRDITNNIKEQGNFEKDIIIGNDVWIGVDAIVRRGVKIGNGAIIGANSFVNRDVPDFAVVAGSPAKIIKMRFNEEKIKQINESKYWEYSPKKAKEILKEISEN